MTEKYLSSIIDPTQSISLDPSALLTTSTINALHFPDLSTSGISDTPSARPINLNLDGVGMCESMTESFCSTLGQDESVLVNNNNGLQSDTSSMTNSLRHLSKKDSINDKTQKKRRSRKAQYDATVDGISFDKIEAVNFNDEQLEADDAWLIQIPNNGTKTKSSTENIFSWVHKEFKENEINANKHRLLCKLDDMSHARTIRSISCHNFPAHQRSDSVKRSSTEQQVNPGSDFDLQMFILHRDISSSDLRENALYLTEIFHLSTLSLDSIDKDDDDRLDFFLYDSLNDDDDFSSCEEISSSDQKLFLQTIAYERQVIEQLTRRCSSLDSLDERQPVHNPIRLTSPIRSSTPLFNGNGNTRPTSPVSSSPLRHTVAIANTTTHIRSRDVSREREPLDFTDLEVMAKVQLENLRQAERQGPLSKRFGGSSTTLLSTDSRDVSPVSVFGATRNTSPVSHTGRMTPRRSYSPSPAAYGGPGGIPIRKNSFVVTESQYAHVLPSVSPRSSSPAVRTGQWSGRVTPSSALETCMETSFIASNNSVFPTHPADEQQFFDLAQGGSNVSLASSSSATSVSLTNRPGNKPPVVPRNGTKPNNHRRSNTQTIVPSTANGFEIPDVTESKVPTTNLMSPNGNRSAVATPASRTRPPVARPIQAYRASQTSYNNAMTNVKAPTSAAAPKNGKKATTDLGSTFTARQFGSNENGFLNDLSNKPLNPANRSQMSSMPRRSVLPQTSVDQLASSSSIDTSTTNVQSSIPRSSSTLSQGRKSGIPTIGKIQRPNSSTMTRPSVNPSSSTSAIPSSQSSDSMMATRNLRTQPSTITRPQIPDQMSPTSSWNEGCY